jgi:tetratricopeptide (TPR) repeat protein
MSEAQTSIAHDQNQVPIDDARQIEQHLRECADCRQQVELMKDAVQVGDQLLNKIVERHFYKPSPKIVRPRFSFDKLRIGWAPGLSAAIAVVLLCAFLPGWINPPYTPQATIHDELGASVFSATRGFSRVNDGAVRYSEGNYAAAIDSFRKSIDSEAEIKDRGVAHLYLGLTYLKVAENRRLGLFYSFDQELADSALAHLNASMKLNGSFPLMQNVALYFSAKAHLMRNDARAASEALKACAAMHIEKSQAAQKLLEEISPLL